MNCPGASSKGSEDHLRPEVAAGSPVLLKPFGLWAELAESGKGGW